MTASLDSTALRARLEALGSAGSPRILLVGCDPLSVGSVDWEVSCLRDTAGRFRYLSIDPAHHLDRFDEAAWREQIARARDQDVTVVLVTTDAEAAKWNLGDYLKADEQIDVVHVGLSWFPPRELRSERGRETQHGIKAWCDLHYPKEKGNLRKKVANLAEEVGELIAALGMDPQAFADRVIKSASRSRLGERASDEEIAGEFADSQIALFDLASTEGVVMDETLVRKLAKLRIRRPDESAQREVRKAALGL